MPVLPDASPFEARFEEVLRTSELPWITTLHQDIEMEILSPERPIFLRFPVFIENPVAGGIKLLKLRHVTEEMVAAQTNDIILTFDTAVAHGILDRNLCIVLHDEPTELKGKHLDRLRGIASLMPVFSEQTPRLLAKAFGGVSRSV